MTVLYMHAVCSNVHVFTLYIRGMLFVCMLLHGVTLLMV